MGRRSSGKENWMMLSLSALCMAPNSLPSGANSVTSARESASAAPCVNSREWVGEDRISRECCIPTYASPAIGEASN